MERCTRNSKVDRSLCLHVQMHDDCNSILHNIATVEATKALVDKRYESLMLLWATTANADTCAAGIHMQLAEALLGMPKCTMSQMKDLLGCNSMSD